MRHNRRIRKNAPRGGPGGHLATARTPRPDAACGRLIAVGDSEVWLGHTRLSILDLSAAGAQPMNSSDGRWWITFNGEIYNHLEIRSDLEGPFRGHSDTETLVNAIAAWGIDRTLARLNGMFAFAALDTRERALYLTRDPCGIKPLYYTLLPGGGILFSSEVRVLRQFSGSPFELDEESLQTFLTLRYVPSPRTLWRGICRLPPGSVLQFDLRERKYAVCRYIESQTTPFTGSREEAIECYRHVLTKAVKRQLLSDVPVGVLLSGGIDSALLTAFAVEQQGPLPTFTVGYGNGRPECELPAARETASILRCSNESIMVSPEALWNALEPAIASIEEPLGTASILPMWHLVQKARERVAVVLTGQGSDEPWGGYTRYQAEVLRRLLPFPALYRFFWSFACRWRGVPQVVERALRSLPVGEIPRRFEEEYALFDSGQRRTLTGREDSGNARKDIENWTNWANRASEPEELMMLIDARLNLADDLLLYGDKLSMAFALEARVPMLDLEVLRFVYSLPARYRVGLLRRKIVHKEMACGYLPDTVVKRPKKDFRVPFTLWSKTLWKDRLAELLLDRGAPHLNVLDRKAIEAIWDDHVKEGRDRGRQIFALAVLAVWWRTQQQ